MKITITDSKQYNWYVDATGQEFDAHLRIHPTFEYREYILSDTERNREYFKDDECSLLMLEHGYMGVEFSHAISDQKFDDEMYEQDKKARKLLGNWDDYLNNMWE